LTLDPPGAGIFRIGYDDVGRLRDGFVKLARKQACNGKIDVGLRNVLEVNRSANDIDCLERGRFFEFCLSELVSP